MPDVHHRRGGALAVSALWREVGGGAADGGTRSRLTEIRDLSGPLCSVSTGIETSESRAIRNGIPRTGAD